MELQMEQMKQEKEASNASSVKDPSTLNLKSIEVKPLTPTEKSAEELKKFTDTLNLDGKK
jgi:hypothetical protein